MSQAQLARKLGTKQPAVARLESGKGNPRLSTIVDLAAALGATMRVDMEPLEAVTQRPRKASWWEPLGAVEPDNTRQLHVKAMIISQTFYFTALPPEGTLGTVAPGKEFMRLISAATQIQTTEAIASSA